MECLKKDANARYYNFKEYPELIPEVLEDFKPYDKHQSIQLFYEIIRWLNGDSSTLESNDCFLFGIRDNPDEEKFPFSLECRGRVMIFFRNLHYNTSEKHMDWLITVTKDCLEQCHQQNWTSCVGITTMDTRFKEIPKSLEEQVGLEMVLEFWAWGNDENETMNNLQELFMNLFKCLKFISEQTKDSQAEMNQWEAASDEDLLKFG